MRDETTWIVMIIGLYSYKPTRSVGLRQTGHAKFRHRILVLDFIIKRSVRGYIRMPTSLCILVASVVNVYFLEKPLHAERC